MDIHTLLASIHAKNASLAVKNGKLYCVGAVAALSDSERAAIKQNKRQLIAHLATPNGAPSAPPLATEPARPGAPTECFSHEQEPQACRHCNGRTWRLRETPQSAGGWLCICAACADRFNDTKIPPYVPAPVEDGDLIDEASTPTPPATSAVLVSGDDGDYIVGPPVPVVLIETCIWCGTPTPGGVCCADCKQRQSGVAGERISA
jgi:hypothetical protein